MFVTAYNLTDSPVVCSTSGRIIGGHDWGTVDTTDDVFEWAESHGWLVQIDGGDLTEESVRKAVETAQQTETWTAQHDSGPDIEKKVLIAQAKVLSAEAGYDPEWLTDAHKADVLTLFIEKGWPLPEPESAEEPGTEPGTAG